MTILASSSPRWSLLIYRVSGDDAQQAILGAFHRIAWPGITVLGTREGEDRFVIVDCESTDLEAHARRIIHRIDAHATRVLRSRTPPPPVPAAS
jgi:hypothetical protein